MLVRDTGSVMFPLRPALSKAPRPIDVNTVTYSSCMEFATEYGFKNDDDAEKIFDASWSKYESMLKSKNALEQFNEIQSTITSEVK